MKEIVGTAGSGRTPAHPGDAVSRRPRRAASAGDSDREFRRRRGAGAGRRRCSTRGPASRGRHPGPRLGIRDGWLSGHPAGSANTLNRGRDRSDARRRADAAAPDEWGTISAWAWGISRIIDYFETDKVDRRKAGRRAGALAARQDRAVGVGPDDRIEVVFPSCSGEMGAALARRDWGETVDDMAQNFPWQFAGNFQKWPGRWNDMPVDAHMLIALSAPRPVFITGGTTDQWADPKGKFLAGSPPVRFTSCSARRIWASPSCRRWTHRSPKAISAGTTTPADTRRPPADWKAFLDFAGKYP